MSERLRSRPAFLIWTFAVAPVLAWAVTVAGTRGEGGVARFVLLFFGLPLLLTAAAGIAARRPSLEIAVGAVVSSCLGGLSWFLTIVYLASQGFFE